MVIGSTPDLVIPRIIQFGIADCFELSGNLLFCIFEHLNLLHRIALILLSICRCQAKCGRTHENGPIEFINLEHNHGVHTGTTKCPTRPSLGKKNDKPNTIVKQEKSDNDLWQIID